MKTRSKLLVLFLLVFSCVLIGQFAFAKTLDPKVNDKSHTNAQNSAIVGLTESATKGLGEGDVSKVPFYKESPAQIVGRVVGIGLSLIGVVYFGLLVYAGFTWMMARGNAEEVHKALDTILHAALGLIIVLAAYAFTMFLTGAF